MFDNLYESYNMIFWRFLVRFKLYEYMYLVKESKRRLLAFNWADSMLYEYFKEKIKRQGLIYYSK